MNKPDWQTAADLQEIERRARLLKSIRAFFDARDVLEIETPVIASAAVTDPHIDSMTVETFDGVKYLNTSPEYCMKRFLAEHHRSCYQVTRSFRQSELGPDHNPEFTMLEWYRMDYELADLMEEVEQLFAVLVSESEQQRWESVRLSYRQVFEEATGIDPHVASIEQWVDYARSQRLVIPVGMATTGREGLQGELDRDAWLDWLMSCHIAPDFPEYRLTTIYDYPESQSALARLAIDDAGVTVARRFECYGGSLELANGYHELNDVTEQKQRFEHDNRKRRLLDKTLVAADEKLLQALAYGLPDCSGVAIGIDRLLRILGQQKSIGQVSAYPWQRA